MFWQIRRSPGCRLDCRTCSSGRLAAALSTAAGLLLVISAAISHDLLQKQLKSDISEHTELIIARVAAGFAVLLAGYFGVHPPDYVAATVAFAFGLVASSFFPAIIMGIFSRRMNREGAISGMVAGILFTSGLSSILNSWTLLQYGRSLAFWHSPEGIGFFVGMVINFVVAIVVMQFTPPPPQDIVELTESIRYPRGAKEAHELEL